MVRREHQLEAIGGPLYSDLGATTVTHRNQSLANGHCTRAALSPGANRDGCNEVPPRPIHIPIGPAVHVAARVPGYEGRFDAIGWHLMGRIFRLKRTLGKGPLSLVDLGMGRGRDLIYFSRRGFRVLGIDIDRAGLLKARSRAARLRTPIRTQLGDIRTIRLSRKFNVVYSSTTLNHLPKNSRGRRIAHFKASTLAGGINAVNAFVSSPDHEAGSDLDSGVMMFRPGELARYYGNWESIEARELGFDCKFGGSNHKHFVDEVIARKPR
jgi:tellurite methyltransferase